jgi:hypothetical protein
LGGGGNLMKNRLVNGINFNSYYRDLMDVAS